MGQYVPFIVSVAYIAYVSRTSLQVLEIINKGKSLKNGNYYVYRISGPHTGHNRVRRTQVFLVGSFLTVTLKICPRRVFLIQTSYKRRFTVTHVQLRQ